MKKGLIQVDPRHTARSIRKATQGNVIRALVELLTNCDDSYVRLANGKDVHRGIIEVGYKKIGFCGLFTVRDYAEGMSFKEVESNFEKYGSFTSGKGQGKKVRGYFGQGAKDALAGMTDGKICTFKNGTYVECKLYIENNNPMYEIYDPVKASNNLRSKHKVPLNGTVAYFKADPNFGIKVPQFKTLHEQLANNYLLRKIMQNSNREVLLVDEESGQSRRLKYKNPVGSEILTQNFTIKRDRYSEFQIQLTVNRSEKELTQSGDDRDGGLLITDDEDHVLGISLFKFDNEPLASRFFGELKISNFNELLINEEPVLREERDGLENKHPFCAALICEVEKFLGNLVKDEKQRKQREADSKVDKEESLRFRRAFSILNEIAQNEVETLVNLGEKEVKEDVPPPDGFCIYPSTAQITLGKKYAFEIRLDTKVVHHGSIIKIVSNTKYLRVHTPNILVKNQDGTGILRKYATVEGLEPNCASILRASTGNLTTEANVYINPEKELLLDEGMDFQPHGITLRPNQSRKVTLLVYIKIIEGGSLIKIHSDNDSIRIEKNEILVNGDDALRHIAKYELEVWGEGPGESALITAEFESYMALLEVRVRSKEEEDEKNKKGMFDEPYYNYEEPEPHQRASFSSESGKVIIYMNFPTVKHYLGKNGEFRKTLPGQIYIAELVTERCFYIIAEKKVDSSIALINPTTRPYKIQSEAELLMKKYGKKLLEILVDQNLLLMARSNLTFSNSSSR